MLRDARAGVGSLTAHRVVLLTSSVVADLPILFSRSGLTELEVREHNRRDVVLLRQEDAVRVEIDVLPVGVNPRRVIEVEQPLLGLVRVVQGPTRTGACHR